jgi:hypothetical protein
VAEEEDEEEEEEEEESKGGGGGCKAHALSASAPGQRELAVSPKSCIACPSNSRSRAKGKRTNSARGIDTSGES